MPDYAKIIIEKNAVSSLRESIDIGRDVMEKKLAAYQNKIKVFEKTNRMDTVTFKEKFEKGELGDNKEWIEWNHFASITSLLQKKLNDLENIRYES
ncbi:MAG: hypothetical protein GY749_04895 [Desulfobacteraceae bacterium]|nr:hypothetical protein [Desulfobacteraceae bacterium]